MFLESKKKGGSAMNAVIDHWAITAAAAERVGAKLRHATLVAISDSVNRAIAETLHHLDQASLLDDIGSYDTGYWSETPEGRRMLGIAKAENILLVGDHEYLIPILTGLVFKLRLASGDKEECEQAV
jgi:hypothetical protein